MECTVDEELVVLRMGVRVELLPFRKAQAHVRVLVHVREVALLVVRVRVLSGVRAGDLDVVLLNFNSYFFSAKLVNTFRFSHKHDFQLGSFRVVVDVLGQSLVCNVILDWNINSDPLLQIDDVLLKCLNFDLSILELFQKFQ